MRDIDQGDCRWTGHCVPALYPLHYAQGGVCVCVCVSQCVTTSLLFNDDNTHRHTDTKLYINAGSIVRKEIQQTAGKIIEKKE